MANRRLQAAQLRRRLRRLPPAPERPPDGYVWMGMQLVRIDEVAQDCRRFMEGYDRLPRSVRDRQKEKYT